MYQLEFTESDVGEQLDEILCSFPTHGHVHLDTTDPNTRTLAELILSGAVTVIRDDYPAYYFIDLKDPAYQAYINVARHTQWRLNANTDIERCRINAFKAMLPYGEARNDGRFVGYPEHDILMYCGNLETYSLISAWKFKPSDLYLFPYPTLYADVGDSSMGRKYQSKYYVFKAADVSAVTQACKESIKRQFSC